MSTGPHVIHWKLRTSATSAAASSGPPPAAATQWSTIQWEGANHLTTLELKRHIAQQLGLGEVQDAQFDFILHNASTGEEYKDDNFIVHRNTSVFARRINASRQRAQQLQVKPTTGLSAATTAASQQSDNDDQQILALVNTASRSTRPGYSSAPPTAYGPQQYQRASHGVRAEGSQQQQQQQQQYSANSKPPPSYVCHRCGEGGHFIRNCPTNGDPAFDGRRPKAALAVQQYEQNAQKIFLRDVEDPKAMERSRAAAAGGVGGGGSMGGVDGGDTRGGGDDRYQRSFQAPPSTSVAAGYATTSYERERERPASHVVDVEARLASRPDLLCPIDHRVFVEPTVVPCCFASFCHQCIERWLLQSTLCFRCKQPLDRADLRPNLGLQKKIEQEKEGGGRQQSQHTGYTGGAAASSVPPPVRRPYEENGYESRSREHRRGGYNAVEERARSPPRYERRGEERYDGRDRPDDRERGARDSDRERDYRSSSRQQDTYPPVPQPREERYPARPPPASYQPPSTALPAPYCSKPAILHSALLPAASRCQRTRRQQQPHSLRSVAASPSAESL